MSKFTQFNSIKPLIKENLWETTDELIFYENNDLSGEKYIVPEGFKTDWCSVRCPLWQWATPKTIWACVLHDYLWSIGEWFLKSNCLFFKALKSTWNSTYQSLKFYLGVTSPIWYLIYQDKVKALKKD